MNLFQEPLVKRFLGWGVSHEKVLAKTFLKKSFSKPFQQTFIYDRKVLEKGARETFFQKLPPQKIYLKIPFLSLWVGIFFFLASSLTPAQEQSPRIIKEIIIAGEGVQNPDQLIRILPFKEGDVFSLSEIAKGMNVLKKTGLFENISWEAEESNDGIIVIISLTPVKFIKVIKFKGAFPLFESDLRRTIQIREGDPFDYDKIKRDEKRLERFLENEGYFHSTVVAKAELDKKTGDLILTFEISKGFTYNLFDVRPHGNTVFSDFWIRSVFRRHMLFRYRRESLDSAVADLLEMYHSRGYFEARIKVREIELDEVFRTVVVYLDIQEGKKAVIKMKGDRHISERKLRKQMIFVEEQSIDEFDVETSARRLEELYRSRGFRNAKVSYKIEVKESKEGKAHVITFLIEPGDKVVVRKVVFKGKTEFTSAKLEKQVLTGRKKHFWQTPVLVDSVLADDVVALENFYKKWGFEEVQIATPELVFNKRGTKVKVYFHIQEGKQTTVGTVSFEGIEFFEPQDAMSALYLLPGAVFDATELAQDKQRLLLLYANHGFPYAEVAQRVEYEDTPQGKLVHITYSIRENERVRVGELIVRGNYKTHARVLTREIELVQGGPFSYDDLLTSRRNLRSLGFLSAVRLDTIGLEERLDTAHLLLLVHESRARSFDLGLGYDSEYGPLASFSARNLNLFGLGKAGKLTLMGGGLLNQAELTYSDPRFMGFRVRADITGAISYYDREAYDLTQASARFAFFRRLSQKFSLTVGVRTEWNDLSNVIDQEAVADLDVTENIVSAIGPELIYDTRNDFINPSNGSLIISRLEYAQDFLNDSNWIKSFFHATTYISGESPTVLVLSVRVGHIEPIGSSLVPIQEAFFVGGSRTVRGYSEDGLGPRTATGDPIGGLDMIITNMEIRFPIWSVIHGVVFIDSGQVAPSVGELSLDNQLFTVGTGIRLYTPVGPVRLDWGYKLEPSPYERRYRWHFSFGYPF